MIDSAPQRIFGSNRKLRNAVLSAGAFRYRAAKMMREQLVSIANSKDWYSGGENGGIDIWTARLQDAGWTARDDDAFPSPEISRWRFTWYHVGIDAKLTHAPRDQVSVLAARIKDRNLRRSYS